MRQYSFYNVKKQGTKLLMLFQLTCLCLICERERERKRDVSLYLQVNSKIRDFLTSDSTFFLITFCIFLIICNRHTSLCFPPLLLLALFFFMEFITQFILYGIYTSHIYLFVYQFIVNQHLLKDCVFQETRKFFLLIIL